MEENSVLLQELSLWNENLPNTWAQREVRNQNLNSVLGQVQEFLIQRNVDPRIPDTEKEDNFKANSAQNPDNVDRNGKQAVA